MDKRNVDAVFLYTVMTEFNRLDNRIRPMFITWLLLMEGVYSSYKSHPDEYVLFQFVVYIKKNHLWR